MTYPHLEQRSKMRTAILPLDLCLYDTMECLLNDDLQFCSSKCDCGTDVSEVRRKFY